jgi:hypothetical protein
MEDWYYTLSKLMETAQSNDPMRISQVSQKLANVADPAMLAPFISMPQGSGVQTPLSDMLLPQGGTGQQQWPTGPAEGLFPQQQAQPAAPAEPQGLTAQQLAELQKLMPQPPEPVMPRIQPGSASQVQTRGYELPQQPRTSLYNILMGGR